MKKLLVVLITMATIAVTSCNEVDTSKCVEIPAQPNIIEPSCEKCFANDLEYDEWLSRCIGYAFIVQDINDPIQMQAASDSLCACN